MMTIVTPDLAALDNLPTGIASLLAVALARRDEERRQMEEQIAAVRLAAWQALLTLARADLRLELAQLLPSPCSTPPDDWQAHDGLLTVALPGLPPLLVRYDWTGEGWVRRPGFDVRTRPGYKLIHLDTLESVLLVAWDAREQYKADLDRGADDENVPF